MYDKKHLTAGNGSVKLILKDVDKVAKSLSPLKRTSQRLRSRKRYDDASGNCQVRKKALSMTFLVWISVYNMEESTFCYGKFQCQTIRPSCSLISAKPSLNHENLANMRNGRRMLQPSLTYSKDKQHNDLSIIFGPERRFYTASYNLNLQNVVSRKEHVTR